MLTQVLSLFARPEVAAALVGAAFVLLLAVWRWRWRDYSLGRRMVKAEAPDVEAAAAAYDERLPMVSVVVPAKNAGADLSELIPLLLRQQYPNFEIIVVDKGSTDDTADVLQQFEHETTRLRHTFVPERSRRLSTEKLAITIGLRAARSEFILLTQPQARPCSDRWIYTMVCRGGGNVVLGYTSQGADGGSFAAYEQLRAWLTTFRAWRRRRLVGGETANMLIRSSAFFEKGGFEGHMALPYGEAAALSANLGGDGESHVTVNTDAVVLQPRLRGEARRIQRAARLETPRRVGGWARLLSLREAAASWAWLLFWLVWLLYVGLRVGIALTSNAYAPEWLAFDAPMLLLFFLALILPAALLGRSTRTLGERGFGLKPAFYDLALPFLRLRARLGRRRARKTYSKPTAALK